MSEIFPDSDEENEDWSLSLIHVIFFDSFPCSAFVL